VLHYTLRSEQAGTLTFHVSGDLAMPPGRLVLAPPIPGPIREVQVNGRSIEAPREGPIVIGELPAKVELHFELAEKLRVVAAGDGEGASCDDGSDHRTGDHVPEHSGEAASGCSDRNEAEREERQ
jgi:hypothetical protein